VFEFFSYTQSINWLRTQLLEKKLICESTPLGIFSGFQNAITEALIGLSQIFRLKRKLLIIGGGSYLQKYLQSIGAALTLEVKLIPWINMEEIRQAITEWDPGVVACPREHIWSTEPMLDLVRKEMKSKRMGLISWSHFRGFDHLDHLLPYEVQVIPTSDSRVVTVSGTRFEFFPKITDFHSFPFFSNPRGDDFNSDFIFENIFISVDTFLSQHKIPIEPNQIEIVKPVYCELVSHQVLLEVSIDQILKFRTLYPNALELSPCQLGLQNSELSWIMPNFLSQLKDKKLYILPD
jgi:hypothetical protein